MFVKIGELAIGSKGEILKATLGSCVGVGILYKEGGKCGLIHCLLPKRGEDTGPPTARYVEEGIPLLLKKMRIITPKERRKARAVIVGGANMNYGNFEIGNLNYALAMRMIKDLGIPLMFSLKSDNKASQILIDSENYTYEGKLLGGNKT